jgi:hypothetical protein
MKYWEIIADNLKKRGWSLGLRVSYRHARPNNLGLLTHIATTESVTFCVRMKS